MDEIAAVVAADDPAFSGGMLKKQTWFIGRWLRHGGQYPALHFRPARTRRVSFEDRLDNQHFVAGGPVGRLRHDYIDILADSLTSWTDRHNRWATLEAAERMAADSHMQVQARRSGSPVECKRFQRTKVYKSFPIFARPRARPALPRLGRAGRRLSMAGERRLPIGGRRASSWGQRCP